MALATAATLSADILRCFSQYSLCTVSIVLTVLSVSTLVSTVDVDKISCLKRIPQTRPGAVHIAQNTQRGRQLHRELQKNNSKKELLKPTRRTQGQRRTDGGKGPFSLQTFARVHPPDSARGGSGMAQGGPGHAETRLHSCPGRGVSRLAILSRTSIPRFDRLPGQSRRSLWFTHML